MKHFGGQIGSLFRGSRSYHGQFVIVSPTGVRRRVSRVIGPVATMSEAEAREKLTAIVTEHNRQAMISMQHVHTADFLPSLSMTRDSTREAKGMLAESMVAADLMGRGFEVFRPIAHFSGCDLLYIHDGKHVRIEVKWVGQSDSAHLRHRLKPNLQKFDLLALVFKDGRIEYRHHSEVIAAFVGEPLIKITKPAPQPGGAQ